MSGPSNNVSKLHCVKRLLIPSELLLVWALLGPSHSATACKSKPSWQTQDSEIEPDEQILCIFTVLDSRFIMRLLEGAKILFIMAQFKELQNIR